MAPVTRSQRENPFKNDLILDTLFKYLPFTELVANRLVCKKWCRHSRIKKAMGQDRCVRLVDVVFQTKMRVEDVQHLFRISGPIFTQYSIEQLAYYDSQIAQEIFSVLGPSMESLTLNLDDNELDINGFREIMYGKAPNLKELKFSYIVHDAVCGKLLFPDEERPQLDQLKSVEIGYVDKQVVEFMCTFFKTLPNLEEIISKGMRDYRPTGRAPPKTPEIETVLEALWRSRAFKTLKVLRVEQSLCSSHVDMLVKMGEQGLQLQTLEIGAVCEIWSDEFEEFAKTQKESSSNFQLIKTAQDVKCHRHHAHLFFGQSSDEDETSSDEGDAGDENEDDPLLFAFAVANDEDEEDDE